MAYAASGCAGRNINSNLKDDPNVLARDWVITTHGPFLAGDRGTEYSRAAMWENTLLFGARSVGLIAIYPKINQTRWSLPIENGVISEIAVDDGNAYFGGGDGFLYSVRIDSGQVNWRYELRNPSVSRPTIAAGKVLVTTTDDVVYALEASSGKWLWQYRRRSNASASILGAAAPFVEGNEAIVGLSDGFLVALSMNEGQLKWERKLHQGTKFTDVDATPVRNGELLYVPSYDGALYALTRSGEIKWRADVGGSRSVSFDGELLYVPSSDGRIYAIQRATGKTVWQFELDRGTPTQIIVSGDLLVFGSSQQYLYAIDKKTGQGRYRYNVGYGSGFAGSPTYDAATRRVYLLSGAGNLYAFRVTQK